MKLEIIGFNIESCLVAQDAGAERIELCASPGEGGTTPSEAFIKQARKKLHIDLYVMIRPRGGDFLYSDEEFEIMKNDVRVCKQTDCNGIVTGLLTADGKVDKAKCRQLIDLAYPLGVTFHRAFDRVCDPFIALSEITELGFERILTSGLKPRAEDSLPLLSQLVREANGNIVIMPGSGVNSGNIVRILEATDATEFHSSASELKQSGMQYTNPDMQESLSHIYVNRDEVARMRTLLDNYPSAR